MRKIPLIALVIFAGGILFVLQVRSFQKVQGLITRASRNDVLQELNVFQIANAELRAHLESEKKALDDLTSAVSNRALEDEIARLRLFAGEEAVSGEGIEITFSAPVEEFWILDLIGALLNAGAEAIAINDIRLTSSTAGLRTVGGGFVMNRTFFRPPLRVTAIGPSQELQKAVSLTGGLLDRIEGLHPRLKILAAPREKIVIPALPKEN